MGGEQASAEQLCRRACTPQRFWRVVLLGGVARLDDLGERHLDIDPRRLGEPELDGVTPFEHRRRDRRTDPGEHGGKRLLARWCAILGPQRRDQLVAADWPVPVQQQVGEPQSTLATAQRIFAPTAAEFDYELTTELDPSTPVRHPRTS
jgi:hypothetical protein